VIEVAHDAKIPDSPELNVEKRDQGQGSVRSSEEVADFIPGMIPSMLIVRM